VISLQRASHGNTMIWPFSAAPVPVGCARVCRDDPVTSMVASSIFNFAIFLFQTAMQFTHRRKHVTHLDYLKPQPHLHRATPIKAIREKPRTKIRRRRAACAMRSDSSRGTLANLRDRALPAAAWRRLHPLYGAHFRRAGRAGWHEFHSPMALSVSLSTASLSGSSRIGS